MLLDLIGPMVNTFFTYWCTSLQQFLRTFKATVNLKGCHTFTKEMNDEWSVMSLCNFLYVLTVWLNNGNKLLAILRFYRK